MKQVGRDETEEQVDESKSVPDSYERELQKRKKRECIGYDRTTVRSDGEQIYLSRDAANLYCMAD